MSSTTRRGELMASPMATSSRLSAARPVKFSACVSSSDSNDYKREVNATPRSKTFSEPMSWKAGSWGEPLSVVHVLVARQPAVCRLPHKVGHRQLRVLSAPVGQVPFDEFTEAQPLIQLTHQEQAAVGSHPCTGPLLNLLKLLRSRNTIFQPWQL